MKTLFRGVSYQMHEQGRSLVPKSIGPFIHVAKWDGTHKWNGDSTWGPSVKNAVNRHQVGQKGLPTSGISTTPDRRRAVFYALHGGQVTAGFVVTLRIGENTTVQIFRVSEHLEFPDFPEDDEHILVNEPPGPLPESLIVNVQAVSLDDLAL